MTTLVTIRAISLGSFHELDTDETAAGSEHAADLVGRSFGSQAAPLAGTITQIGLHDGNSDGNVVFGDHVVGSEHIIVAGQNRAIDGGTLYFGTVTYMDGSSADHVPLRIMQDGAGNLYLVPPPSDAAQAEIVAVTQKPIASIQVAGIKQNNFATLNSSRYGLADPVFLCFRNGTLITTDRGERPVETLRPGDLVLTRDNGLQPIRWIGAKRVSGTLMQAFPRMRPVRIRAGALGDGLPARDLYLSQQHRILVRSQIARHVTGQPEVLVAAKFLTELDGITVQDDSADLTYFHILFDRHEILLSEGAQTESLFTGPEALKAVSPEDRAEILMLFPDLLRAGAEPVPVRQLSTGRQGRELARRHGAKGRALQGELRR